MQKQKIKIATIDLYNNERNEGMRCIGEIVEELINAIEESDKTLEEKEDLCNQISYRFWGMEADYENQREEAEEN